MPKSKRKYVPSQSIKKLIILWEGTSMKTNNSFESEAAMFQNYLEQAGIFDLMSQDELDGLYSYSYNVGSGNFAKRTLPHLIKLYNGTGTLENVLKNIYGKRDSEPGLPGLRIRRKYERNLFAKGYRNRISKLKPKKVAENNITTTLEVTNTPQITLDITGLQLPLAANYLQKPTVKDLTQTEDKNIMYPVRKRSIEDQLQGYYNGGKLIRKGQLGTPLYKEIHLLKDPGEEHQPTIHDSTLWMPELYPKARMDATVQQLTDKLSTYKPTPDLTAASTGIKHKMKWYDWVPSAITTLPFVAAAAATAPEWGPAALTAVSNPAFWGELLKDTGAYIAVDAASLGLTGKGIGAHVNNAIGLQEDHPIGEILSFGAALPTKSLIHKGINFTKLILKPNLALNKSLITRVVLPNGKIRIRLSSHTDEMPREIVLEPLGNNKFYIHIRTWDDVNRKIPANLALSDINLLYEAFYSELPEGAEVLVPESGPGNYATRGTIAGLKRLARDKRFSPGKKGKVLYDDNGKIKTYKTTSFIKRLPVDEEYINRQLIPLAQQLGNWQGHTPITSNVAERTTFLSDPRIPFAGLFNGSGYYVNTFAGPELTLPTYLHEIRHGLDFSIKYNSFTGENPIKRFLETNPLYMFKKGTYRPIQLTKKQIKLLNEAYPTKFKIPLLQGRQMAEKIAVNAEMRYLFDNLYYKTFGKKPTVEQLNSFINILPDDIFVETLFGSRSAYMHTYMSNIVKPLSKTEGTFTIHTPPSPIDGTTTIKVNKNVLGSESIKRMKQAITSVPSIAGIGYGIYNTQKTP